MPRPGELRQLIRIGHTAAAQNENGYPESHDEYVCRCFAKVEKSGNSMAVETGANVVAQAMIFSIRYRDGITEGMWIEYRGRKWTIIDSTDYDGRRRYLGFKTMAGQEVAG